MLFTKTFTLVLKEKDDTRVIPDVIYYNLIDRIDGNYYFHCLFSTGLTMDLTYGYKPEIDKLD